MITSGIKIVARIIRSIDPSNVNKNPAVILAEWFSGETIIKTATNRNVGM
jgi:hypothetical protein